MFPGESGFLEMSRRVDDGADLAGMDQLQLDSRCACVIAVHIYGRTRSSGGHEVR